MTRTTLGLLAADALLWLVSALPVGLIGALVADRTGIAIALAAWTLSAALAFLRPVELWLARFLFRAREPTAEERARLEPVWQQVCALAQEDLRDYVLRIEDRDELNATAGGARIVSVTTLALTLPDDELSAILAHELGHHLDEHPIAALLGWWFALPAAIFDAILRFFGGILIVFTIWRLALLVPLLLARLASAVLNRTAEYAADRHAARLGFGPALLRLFDRMLAQGPRRGAPRRSRPRAAVGDAPAAARPDQPAAGAARLTGCRADCRIPASATEPSTAGSQRAIAR